MAVQSLKLRGLVAPAFTPMRADGSLDLATIDALAQFFRDTGVAGVFMETHPDPDCAPSDGPNLLPLSERDGLLTRAVDVWARISQ